MARVSSSRWLGGLFAGVMVVAGVGVIALAGVAGADCAGPSITFPHIADRGAELRVKGTAWIDGCDDTGGPIFGPEPGKPVDDIELTLVQGQKKWVMWTGRSNTRGELRATVTVPIDAAPGDALLIASRGHFSEGGTATTDDEDPALHISDAPPRSTPSTSPLPPPFIVADESIDTPESSTTSTPIAMAATVAVSALLVLAAYGALRRRHNDRPRTTD